MGRKIQAASHHSIIKYGLHNVILPKDTVHIVPMHLPSSYLHAGAIVIRSHDPGARRLRNRCLVFNSTLESTITTTATKMGEASNLKPTVAPPQKRAGHLYIPERLRFASSVLVIIHALTHGWDDNLGMCSRRLGLHIFLQSFPSSLLQYSASMCLWGVQCPRFANTWKHSVIFMHNLKLPWGANFSRPEEFGLSRMFCSPYP